MSDVVLDRIAAWEAAGLIDAATAARLRAAESAAPPDGEPAASPPPRVSMTPSFFGPAVTIVEAFSYLGAAFVLAAWTALIARLSSEASVPTNEWIIVAGLAIAAAVFFVIGLVLHGRSARLGRAAGVAFVLSVAFIAGGVTANVAIVGEGATPALAGAAAALVAAIAYRWYHPALLTQAAMLLAIAGLVQAWLSFLDESLVRSPVGTIGGTSIDSATFAAVVASIFWIACAILLGLIGLAEARAPGVNAARRAALTRFWAGVVAVVGVASAVMRTEFVDAEAHRIVEPWVGQLIVLAISAVLLQRAFSREAGAYVVAAALGVVIALTDFNFTYFAAAGGTEVALLIEGLLLIAIAFGAERLSRRVGDRDRDAGEPHSPSAPEGPPDDPADAATAEVGDGASVDPASSAG
jgi:hypothetical protein